MDYSVLIIAAGNAAAQGKSYKRAFASFNGNKNVLEQTVSVFLEDEKCKQIVLVASSADLSRIVGNQENRKTIFVKGAKTRMESVVIGLMAVSEDTVLIHDGVRPWIKRDAIRRLTNRMDTEKACVLAIRPKGSLRSVKDGYISEKIKTNNIVMLQTPQAFNTAFIIDCYQKAIAQGHNLLDDSEVVAKVSDVRIAVEEGDLRNTRFLLKNKD